jgi:hypothetical protein
MVEQGTALAGLRVRSLNSRAGPKPPGHTRVPCEELADGKACRPGRTPMSGTARVSRRKRGPDPDQRRDGAPRGAAPSGLKVRTCYKDALFRRSISLGFGAGAEKLVPAKAGRKAAYPGPQRIRAMALARMPERSEGACSKPDLSPLELGCGVASVTWFC